MGAPACARARGGRAVHGRHQRIRSQMTLTVIAREAGSGLLGIAQTTNPLSVGARCPFIRANVGAVSTQAYTDPGLGPLALELLAVGHSPQKVIAELAE